jgi:hypothetical protein
MVLNKLWTLYSHLRVISNLREHLNTVMNPRLRVLWRRDFLDVKFVR